MPLAQVIDGQATEVVTSSVTHGNVQSSVETLLIWSEAERNAVGVYTIAEATIPDGHDVVSRSLVLENDGVRRAVTTQPAAISPQAVVSERERRLAAGFDYDFGDGRGVHTIGTTPADMFGWDAVSKLASAAIALGQPNTPIAIVTNTGPATVTALEWQQILVSAATEFQQPIWAASFALQAMSPIPADYASDARWP